MLRHWFCSLAIAACAVAACRADVTLRYTLDFKISDAAPAAIVAPIKTQLALLAKEQLIRIKGAKTLSEIGGLHGIVDTSTQTITLVNPATKQYSSMPMDDYLAAVQGSLAIPASAKQALQTMKFDVQSSDTGQSATVSGIHALEHLMVLSVSMNLPGANLPSGPLMRIDIHTWLASPGDLGKVAALREYTDSVQKAMRVFNTADMMEKIAGQIPGLGEKFRAATQDMMKTAGSMTVKMQESFYMPMMAALQPGSNPNAALMEMHMDLAEISSAPLDDAAFQVPADYQSVPGPQIMQALRSGTPPAPKATEPARQTKPQ